MDGAQVMKSHHGRALEAEVSLEVLGDFTDEALEGQLADDEQLSRLLATTNLPKIDGTPVDLRAVCLVRAMARESWEHGNVTVSP